MRSWKELFGNKFRIGLAIIFIAEIFSFIAYYFQINNIAFFIITAIILVATIYNLGIGLLVALSELIIGSMGYLFYMEAGGMEISLRMAIWMIIIGVWLAREVYELIYKKSKGVDIIKQFKQTINFILGNYIVYFIILFVFISWGVLQGYINDNSLNNIFFDFNGYLYFALIFPAYKVVAKLYQSYYTSTILQIFTASLSWITLKSLTILFIFSHSSNFNIELIYNWIRDTEVAEITEMQEGIYRIFFQSHIFVSIGFLFFLFVLTSYLFHHPQTFKNILSVAKLKTILPFLYISSLVAVIIISFSRSLWVGTVAGLFLWIFFSLQKYGWKKTGTSLTGLIVIAFISFGLITAVVSFPYPTPTGKYSAGKALSSRTQETTQGDAAISSRWNLLPRMGDKIKQAPLLGQGFGSTITYESEDPRVLEQNPQGTYTTFAFEWGWLDIWLKLGFLGLMCYIFILGKLLFEGFSSSFENHKDKIILISLTGGVTIIAVVNFFTPYLNHPLGIGYLMISALFIDKFKKRI